MASPATLEPPAPSTERELTRAQALAQARGCWGTRAAEPAPPPVSTVMLAPAEIADPVGILPLLQGTRESGQVRPERWRLTSVVYRLLVAQARSDESSTIRIGTHWFDEHRLLPALRRDPATDRETHHEHVRRALAELVAAGLISTSTVYDSEHQEQATDVRLLPAPAITAEEAKLATKTIARWYDRYGAGWRRPLTVRGRAPRRRPKKAVVVEANVPPVPGLPPSEVPNGTSRSSVAKAQKRAGELEGNALRARNLSDGENRESPRLRRMMEVDRDGAGRAARDGLAQPPTVSGSSADDGPELSPFPTPDSTAGLGRDGVQAGSGSLGADGGPLTPSDAVGGGSAPHPSAPEDAPGEIGRLAAAERPLTSSDAISDQLTYIPASWTEEARDAATTAPPLGALLDDQALAELREVLGAAGLLSPTVGPDGLGRLNARQLQRLADDIAAWPSLRGRHPGWEQVGAVEAIRWVAVWAGRLAAEASGNWPYAWLTTWEREQKKPTIPLAVLARYFSTLCRAARQGRKLDRFLSPAPVAAERRIAQRPSFLSRATDGGDEIVRCGEFLAYVACDWIPSAEELAREAPALARLWGALLGYVPVTIELRCEATGDYALVKLRKARDDENPGPREPVVKRGRGA